MGRDGGEGGSVVWGVWVWEKEWERGGRGKEGVWSESDPQMCGLTLKFAEKGLGDGDVCVCVCVYVGVWVG